MATRERATSKQESGEMRVVRIVMSCIAALIWLAMFALSFRGFRFLQMERTAYLIAAGHFIFCVVTHEAARPR